MSFHPAIKREFVGKRPRVEEESIKEEEDMVESIKEEDLVEVKQEGEEDKDSVIMDQENLVGYHKSRHDSSINGPECIELNEVRPSWYKQLYCSI